MTQARRLPAATFLFSLLSHSPMTLYADHHEDPYLWLEDIEGEETLAWARERNEETLAALQGNPEYERLFEKNLAVYDSQERIAYPAIRGEHLFNFWRDASNQRGLWRRTTVEEYRKDEPAWEVLLDLDALAEEENENWVWGGSSCLPPAYDRCLVSLSRGGADASVTREFDVPSKSFVTDGFNLPEAKGGATFIDRDTVFVNTEFGEGSMT